MDEECSQENSAEGDREEGEKRGGAGKEEGYQSLKKKDKKEESVSISCDVIRVFRSESIDGYNRLDLRVAKWSSGKERVLEKRRAWTTKEGLVRNRQLIGLSASDIDFIVEHRNEIMEALKGEKDGGIEEHVDGKCNCGPEVKIPV